MSTEKQNQRQKQVFRAYNARFTSFKQKLNLVGSLKPREDYLYPLMRGVAFKDMETAVEMTLMRFGKILMPALKRQKTRKKKGTTRKKA